MFSKILIALVMSIAVVWSAAAQGPAGDLEAGRTFALKSCSECHVVDDTRQVRASDSVPSFAAIAGDRKATAKTLRTFLQAPHGQMPDFILTREEIDNVIAYIVSLRRH